jgi:hypothetical protein
MARRVGMDFGRLVLLKGAIEAVREAATREVMAGKVYVTKVSGGADERLDS